MNEEQKQLIAAAPQPAPKADNEDHKWMIQRLHEAFHYPECWDTMAYPTVWDALSECASTFRCSNDDCAAPKTEQQGWYYNQCRREVDPVEVAYDGAHVACGRVIFDDEAPKAEQQEPAGFVNGDRLSRNDARQISPNRGAYYDTPLYLAPPDLVAENERLQSRVKGIEAFWAGLCNDKDKRIAELEKYGRVQDPLAERIAALTSALKIVRAALDGTHPYGVSKDVALATIDSALSTNLPKD